MIRRLLVSISHSPAASAEATIAIDIAQRHNASVMGFTVVDVDRLGQVGPAPAGAFSYRIRLIEARKKRAAEVASKAIEELQNRCDECGVAYHGVPMEGAPDSTLAGVWRFQDLGLIPTRPWAPGEDEPEDVAAVLHLIAMGLRPMLAIPPDAPTAITKALVALSGSLDSAKAFKQFVQMSIWPGIDLHLVTVGDPKSGESAATLLEQAQAYAADHDLETTTAALPQSSDRTQSILDEAAKVGSQVIVAGSSYRRFLVFEKFGSHATGLLERSPVALFISH